MRKSFFLAYVAMLLASCSTQTLVPQFALTAVSNGYGTDTENIVNSTIARTQTKRVIGGEIYQYEEEIEVYSHDEVTHEYTCDEFQIKWMIDRTRLNFDLLNTSGDNLRIIWQEAIIVDVDDYAYRVYHEHMKYIDRLPFTPDMIVPDGARCKDFVVPIGNAVWTGNNYHELPLVARAQLKRNETIKVILPIEAYGRRMDYTFTFTITDIKVQKTKMSLF